MKVFFCLEAEGQHGFSFLYIRVPCCLSGGKGGGREGGDTCVRVLYLEARGTAACHFVTA